MTRLRGEFELISGLLAPLGKGDPRSLGFVDDAAVLPPKEGVDRVVSTDTMIEGIHFLADEDAEAVARRLLRVNLSDMAAMGASPDAYFLNLSLRAQMDDRWAVDFARGLSVDQGTYSVRLLGGDVTRTDASAPLTMSVTMIGETPAGEAVTRSGAAAGDLVMVSGTIGDAMLGLHAMSLGTAGREALVDRYRLPEPRIALGCRLRGVATAMADVSDGLLADLEHICAASGIGADLQAVRIPLSQAARDAAARIEDLATGGGDYELVFCVRPEDRERALAAGEGAGVAVSEIGVATAEAGGVTLLDGDGAPIRVKATGWRHF